MQALIDYDGWRKWKDSKDLTTTLSPANKPAKAGKKSATGKGKAKGGGAAATGRDGKKASKKSAEIKADAGGGHKAEEVVESGVPVFSSIPDGVDGLVDELAGGDDDDDDDDDIRDSESSLN